MRGVLASDPLALFARKFFDVYIYIYIYVFMNTYVYIYLYMFESDFLMRLEQDVISAAHVARCVLFVC